MEQSDYFSLLNRAIVKLESNTPEARSEIYDRARRALRNQLGAMQPRLPDAAVAKELQQLEGAIRQLEPPQKIQPEPKRQQQAPAQPRSVASRGIFCEVLRRRDHRRDARRRVDAQRHRPAVLRQRRAMPGMCVGDPHLVVDLGLVAGRAAGVVSVQDLRRTRYPCALLVPQAAGAALESDLQDLGDRRCCRDCRLHWHLCLPSI